MANEPNCHCILCGPYVQESTLTQAENMTCPCWPPNELACEFSTNRFDIKIPTYSKTKITQIKISNASFSVRTKVCPVPSATITVVSLLSIPFWHVIAATTLPSTNLRFCTNALAFMAWHALLLSFPCPITLRYIHWHFLVLGCNENEHKNTLSSSAIATAVHFPTSETDFYPHIKPQAETSFRSHNKMTWNRQRH